MYRQQSKYNDEKALSKSNEMPQKTETNCNCHYPVLALSVQRVNRGVDRTNGLIAFFTNATMYN